MKKINIYSNYKKLLKLALLRGYKFYNCKEYYSKNSDLLLNNSKFCVLRHDVDFAHERVIFLAEIEKELAISSTYFFRIHANEYNLLSYDLISLIKYISSLNHEIALHAEPLDIEEATGFNPFESLKIGKIILESICNQTVTGIASHNDPTPVNNLNFFSKNSIKKLGFEYEAYSKEFKLFQNSYYISDSHPWFWKTYHNGKITNIDDHPDYHIEKGLSPLYILIHPHMWYHKHFNLRKY